MGYEEVKDDEVHGCLGDFVVVENEGVDGGLEQVEVPDFHVDFFVEVESDAEVEIAQCFVKARPILDKIKFQFMISNGTCFFFK